MRTNHQQKTKTYSQATQQQPLTISQVSTSSNDETFTKIFTCIIHAHMQNIANPGTYEDELNKTLKLNKLPGIKIPTNPDSQKIIKNISFTKSNLAYANEDKTSVDEEEETEEPIATDPNISKIQAKDLGLTIYTSESTGWPKKSLTKTDLIEALEKKKYKLTYEDKSFTYFQIIQNIMDDNIILHKCWEIIDDDSFKKIRHGTSMERTPPSRTEKIRKKSL